MRNSEERLGAHSQPDLPIPAKISKKEEFDFVVPTEHVALPSKGAFYLEDHPLHNKDTVEIKFMTAKDEDILSSKTLIKKGIAVERLMERLIVDECVSPANMLSGDRNAIILAARISAYGSGYNAKAMCPSCNTSQNTEVDLGEAQKVIGADAYKEYDVQLSSNNTFLATMPKSNAIFEFKPINGKQEKHLVNLTETKRKKKLPESMQTDQIKVFTVSINGNREPGYISKFVDMMPAFDSYYLRGLYEKVVPTVNLRQDFTCEACGHEQEMEVALGAEFFWPKQ